METDNTESGNAHAVVHEIPAKVDHTTADLVRKDFPSHQRISRIITAI